MAQLGELLETLGTVVMEVRAAPLGRATQIDRVVLHDQLEKLTPGPGDLVVGIGVVPGHEVVQLLAKLAADGAAGLILRESQVNEAAVQQAVDTGVALVSVPLGTDWVQLTLLLSSILSRGDFGAPDDNLSGVDHGDLFAVANVVADMVGAPVTIEDSQSRVLAFSGGQGQTDAARIATILGREVPAGWLRSLQNLGIFHKLTNERGPVRVPSLGPDHRSRVAIAVRAGDEVIGSIWAAPAEESVSGAGERDWVAASSFVALHLLHHRLVAEAQSGLELELLSAVLRGGSLAEDAAHRLGLVAPAYRVVALSARADGQSQDILAGRIRTFAAMHFSTQDRRVPVALLGDAIYGIVPSSGKPEQSLRALKERCEPLIARALTLMKAQLYIGAGPQVATVAEIPTSRGAAERALRILTERGTPAVAEITEVRADALIKRVVDSCANDPELGRVPLERLQLHDRENGTAYVSTLRAYLDPFGDLRKAGRALGVHPNTIRYRLKQLENMPIVDLADPTVRLAPLLLLP